MVSMENMPEIKRLLDPLFKYIFASGAYSKPAAFWVEACYELFCVQPSGGSSSKKMPSKGAAAGWP